MELFSWLQNHWFGPRASFFPQKNNFADFFKWLFNFNMILKTCFMIFDIILHDFTLLNNPLEPYKLSQNKNFFIVKYFRFYFFLMLKLLPPPPEKSHSLFPSNPPLKIEILPKPRRGGCLLWQWYRKIIVLFSKISAVARFSKLYHFFCNCTWTNLLKKILIE